VIWRYLLRTRFLLRRPWRLLAVVALGACIAVGALVPLYYLRAEARFRAAREALDGYRFREAREYLAHCQQVWPNDVEVHLLSARLARQTGDFDQADRLLEKCRLLQGGTDERIALEQVLVRAQRGETDAVFNHCRVLVEKEHPASPLILDALAQGYLRVYRLADADYALDMWLNRQPDNPQALFIRGWVFEHWERAEEAAELYRRALAAKPEHDQARLHLVRVLVENNAPAEAAVHLAVLARRLPDDPAALVYRGRCRFLAGDLDGSDQVLKQAVARFPRFAAAHAALGQVAHQAGKLDLAEESLSRAVALAPGDYSSRYLLYQTFVLRGKKREAADELERVNASKADADALRQILTHRLRDAPHDPTLHHELGAIFLRSGDLDEALRWFNKALEYDPGHKKTHAALADYYARVGHVGRASRHRLLAGVAAADPPGALPRRQSIWTSWLRP
jgi:Tfp pilus assembly protein PilF